MNIKIRLLSLIFLCGGGALSGWQEILKKKIAENNVPEWMRFQIDSDLKLFYGGITREMLEDTLKYSCGIAQFKIIDNKVYSENKEVVSELGAGISVGGAFHKQSLHNKRSVVHNALTDLAACCSLPNIEFLLVVTDGVIDTLDCPGPLFAFSKNKEKNNNIITIPDPDVLENHITLRDQVLDGNKEYSWNKKIKKAFWRGGATHQNFGFIDLYKDCSRFKLIMESRKNPHILDALFTRVHSSNKNVQKALTKFLGKHIPIKEHLKYAYQVQIDGYTAAWARMYWELFCNSVMLKQESDNIQWYYAPLQPYVHYIPLKNDVSDIEEKVIWARNNDNQVQAIIKNANNFAQENLGYENILYYIYLLITEYAQLQQFDPTL